MPFPPAKNTINQTADLLANALRPALPSEVFDFWARELGSTHSKERVFAKIVAKRAESSRAVTLELQPNRHFQGFESGQHVNVTVEIDGRRMTRSYSLTGIARSKRLLSLCVQKVAGGRVSTHLFSESSVGDLIELDTAFGAMTLPAELPSHLLFLAAGSGITPLMSLTRELAARGMPVQTTLLYWARHRSDLCFLSELKALAARHRNFTLRIALTGDAVTQVDELRGRPCTELLAHAIPDLSHQTVFACGHSGFVDEIEAICKPLARSFMSEAFTPPNFNSSGTSADMVNVMLAKSNRLLQVPTHMPLLAALEAQGIHSPSGCRMGICNTCACPKRHGVSRNLKHGGENAEPESNLRICVSSAQTDLTLDL